jgi:hypothetical protein
MMNAPVRIPILVAIGLAMGLLVVLALVHFFWIAVVLIIAMVGLRYVRRRR